LTNVAFRSSIGKYLYVLLPKHEHKTDDTRLWQGRVKTIEEKVGKKILVSQKKVMKQMKKDSEKVQAIVNEIRQTKEDVKQLKEDIKEIKQMKEDINEIKQLVKDSSTSRD